MQEFKDVCESLNKECIAAIAEVGVERQVVDERTAIAATETVKSLVIKGAGDLLLFGASMNALNTYVKQDGNKKTFGYFFKRYADLIVRYMLENTDENVRADIMKDKNKNTNMNMEYLLVDIYGLQCSFHNITMTDAAIELKARSNAEGHVMLEFDGVKKQKCANTFFKGAFENTYLRNNETLDGSNLIDEINKLLEAYDRGEITALDVKPQKHKEETKETH